MENRKLRPADGERVAAAKREIRSRSIEGIERRTVASRVELRASYDSDEFTIEGHAAVFNTLTEDLGYYESWFEKIDPGAFKTVLSKNPDVRALFNHDPNYVLARTKSNTLVVREDDDGLYYEADVDGATDIGKRLRSSLSRGDVDQSSFAFRVARKGDSWEEDEQGRLVRTIHQFSELYDVSPVTYPATTTTDVSLASRDVADDDLEGDDSPDSDAQAEMPDVEQSSGDGTEAAPEPEREADEGTSPSAADDGGDEDEEADEPQVPEGEQAGDEGQHALAIRQRRMKAMQAMGLAPDA